MSRDNFSRNKITEGKIYEQKRKNKPEVKPKIAQKRIVYRIPVLYPVNRWNAVVFRRTVRCLRVYVIRRKPQHIEIRRHTELYRRTGQRGVQISRMEYAQIQPRRRAVDNGWLARRRYAFVQEVEGI